MPFGLGKSSVVAVYTTEEFRQKALEAGADIVLEDKDLENVQIQFHSE